MGTAEDFTNSFFAAYPDARSGKVSMAELNRLIGEYQRKMNSNPLDDFDGLSPEQMTALLYTPFAPGSVLQFRKDINAHVKRSPFFSLSELLLKEIKQAGTLKLTANGNLPVRICELLCNQNWIYLPYLKFVKRVREEEIPYLWPLKQYLLDEGIVKKRNNALSLTKNGEKLMQGPAEVRFIQIFNYMATRFHWSNFYSLEDGGKCGQVGWAYSLVLLSKYGDNPEKSKFYSLKLIRAFEKELWANHLEGKEGMEIEDYHHVYEVRFFECFAAWFGLISIERKRGHSVSFIHQLLVTKSGLFDQLFEVKN